MPVQLRDITNADVSGKRVLVRADLNVPLTDGKVTDATRIARFAPTVTKLLKRGASVVVMTHLGRPMAEANPHFSTAALAQYLGNAVGVPVAHVPDCIGENAESTTGRMVPGDVVLLENLRFHPGETRNDRSFALRLSVHADLFVNDAFSCAHRAHASTHAIARVMPAYAGPSMIREVEALDAVLERPERPVAALVGGAKVSTKIDVLTNLVARTDYLIVGGGMANTFLAAQGSGVGKSLYEPDAVHTAQDILERAHASGCEIVLPEDAVVAHAFEAHAPGCTVPVDAIPEEMMALDVGTKSQARVTSVLKRCRTLLWNGPLGAFEIEPFGTSTFAVARAAADLTAAGKLTTVAGGGDTVAALNAAGVTGQFTYVSTAGGAFLEWLEGKTLPGIEVLQINTNEQEAS